MKQKRCCKSENDMENKEEDIGKIDPKYYVGKNAPEFQPGEGCLNVTALFLIAAILGFTLLLKMV